MESLLQKLLPQAEVKIQEEIRRTGFIDDSDNADRFLDKLAMELAKEKILQNNVDIELYYKKETEIEQLQEQLLPEIKDKIMSKYNNFSTITSGHYEGCYYETIDGLKAWREN